jgi:hypothetical protein
VRGRLGGQVWLDPPVLDACYAPLLPDVQMRIDIIRRERGAGHPKKCRSGRGTAPTIQYSVYLAIRKLRGITPK